MANYSELRASSIWLGYSQVNYWHGLCPIFNFNQNVLRNMCFLSRLHVISFRGPRSFKLGFQKLAPIPGHCPQAPKRPPPSQHRSVPATSSSERERPAGTVCAHPSPFILLPNYIPRFYVKSNIVPYQFFFFLLIPHQEYPITFINTCFKNITVVSCCFKFSRAMQDFRLL